MTVLTVTGDMLISLTLFGSDLYLLDKYLDHLQCGNDLLASKRLGIIDQQIGFVIIKDHYLTLTLISLKYLLTFILIRPS